MLAAKALKSHAFPYAIRPTGIRSKRGKSPGTQVQHTLDIGTIGTELRHFLTFTYGTMWAITKSARTFAPLTIRGVVGIEPDRLGHQVVQQIQLSGVEVKPFGADGGSLGRLPRAAARVAGGFSRASCSQL